MNVILIGGREETKTHIIEEYVYKESKSDKVLFFPTASLDDPNSLIKFKNSYGMYFKNIDVLNLHSNPSEEEVLNKLNEHSTLYFGGGNTSILVEMIKKYKIDKYLKNSVKLLVGISAGANMLAISGMGDSVSYRDSEHVFNYKMVDGIGLLNIVICPHYNHTDLDVFNDEIYNYNCDAYALEDDTLIHFKDGLINVIKSNKKRSVYSFKISEERVMKSMYEEKKIAVLGPEGTFSDVACHKYLSVSKKNVIPEYYPSIKLTTNAISKTNLAILPFENTLDGYVLDSIDGLIKNNYHIICDLNTKVEFAFVSNATDIKDVKSVFVQFKAKGQVLDFLTVNNNFKLITTESNIESLNNLSECDDTFGAIIPMHKLNSVSFNTVIKNVEDRESNYTRFIVVSNENNVEFLNEKIKCSLCVFLNEERPGLLFELLKVFNDHKLNLTSIISRPTKEELGKYNFYIEIEANSKDIDKIKKIINDISNENAYIVKNLGIYSSIGDE